MKFFLNPKLEKIEKPDNEPVHWRISCYGLALAENQTVLMMRPQQNKKIWVLPGGGLNIDESIPEAIVRETYEETGYRVKISSSTPLTLGETDFFDPVQKKFYHSINLVLPIRLTSGIQDTHIINTVEPEEVEEVKWVPLSEITKDTCHFIMWPSIQQLKHAKR